LLNKSISIRLTNIIAPDRLRLLSGLNPTNNRLKTAIKTCPTCRKLLKDQKKTHKLDNFFITVNPDKTLNVNLFTYPKRPVDYTLDWKITDALIKVLTCRHEEIKPKA
jgi:hypothetical protein